MRRGDVLRWVQDSLPATGVDSGCLFHDSRIAHGGDANLCPQRSCVYTIGFVSRQMALR